MTRNGNFRQEIPYSILKAPVHQAECCMINKKKYIIEFFVCCSLVGAIFIGIRYFNLDLRLSEKLYLETDVNETLLGLIAFIGKYLSVLIACLLLTALPWLYKKKHPFRKEALLAVLLLGTGPGLINNFVLKPFFNRPRPNEIKHFNKNSSTSFIPVLQRNPHGKFRSFPSGHTGAAFFLMFPWFFLRLRQRYGLKLLLPGFIFGCVIGTTRIIQGKHFLSDTIASFTLVYVCGLMLAMFFLQERNKQLCRAYGVKSFVFYLAIL